MLIGQDFQGYFAKETITINLVSTQKPEEPIVHYSVMSELAVTIKNWLIKSKFLPLAILDLVGKMYSKIHSSQRGGGRNPTDTEDTKIDRFYSKLKRVRKLAHTYS